jgi:hypothetical protein
MKFKRLRYLTIVVLSLILGGSTFVLVSKRNHVISKTLGMMTQEERYYLDAFLRRILFSDDFSYVLFGNKPCAFTSYSKSITFDITYDDLTISNIKIKRGLEVFRKYQHFFPSRKFVFHFYDHLDDLIVLLINKSNLSHAFNKYKSDFEQILGPEITSKKLLAQIAESDDFGEVIKNHQALLGILLGYGRNNAWLFYNRTMAFYGLDKFDPSLKRTALLEKKIAELNQQLQPFSTDQSSLKSFLKKPLIELPHFMADSNSLETKELKERYEKDREKIRKTFSKQNITEITLQQLMDN